MNLLDGSYGYSNYEEWNFHLLTTTAKKNKGGIAIASKVFSARDFLGEFLIIDVIFLQEFLSISRGETKRWLKLKQKLNTLKKPIKF